MACSCLSNQLQWVNNDTLLVLPHNTTDRKKCFHSGAALCVGRVKSGGKFRIQQFSSDFSDCREPNQCQASFLCHLIPACIKLLEIHLSNFSGCLSKWASR